MSEEEYYKKHISLLLKNLSKCCLENSEDYHRYEDKDLENATLIFSHVLMDVIFSENKHLNEEKINELAVEVGSHVRELIRWSTGKDMHEIVKIK